MVFQSAEDNSSVRASRAGRLADVDDTSHLRCLIIFNIPGMSGNNHNGSNATSADKRVQRMPTRFVAVPSKRGLTLPELDRPPQTRKNSATATRQQKKQSGSSVQRKSSTARSSKSASDEDEKTTLKPRFQVGDPVYAAWWPENMRFASTPSMSSVC